MMSLPSILYLFRARLRARVVLVQEGFALFGIAVGVALLFASQVASTSLSHSVARLDRQVVGDAQFQLQSRGPDGFDERLLAPVRRIRGVRSALPVMEQQANVVGPDGQSSVDLIGVAPGFAALKSSLLRRFTGAHLGALEAIAVPAPLAHTIGAVALQSVGIQAGADTTRTVLGAVLQGSEIGGAIDSPIAVAPIHYAQDLAGMRGRVTRILIRCDPARERSVATALARLAKGAGINFEPSNYDSKLFAVAVAPENKSEALFSAISALVAFMFALNAMLITVPSRRRLLKEVRLQGATRPVLIQILLFDALVLGGLACVIGLPLGELLSLAVFHTTPGYLSFAFPVGSDRIITWQSVVLAVGAGLAAALIGVLWPLRGVLARPLESESATAGHRRKWTVARLAVGVVCLAFTTVIPALHSQGEVVGNLVLVIALVCLLPLLFDGFVALFARAQRPFSWVASALAVIELKTPPTRVRSLAIAVTASIAVFGAIEFEGIQHNLTTGLDASAQSLDSNAQVWVTPRGEANALATTAFVDSSSHALARLPGVRAVALYRGGFLNWGVRRLWVLAPPRTAPRPVPLGQVTDGNPALATARIRRGGWAVLSQALAAEHRLRVGQAFELPSPRPITLRVAAISTNLSWPSGALILNATDYARAWASSDPSAYEIQTRPGSAAATVRAEVQHALGSSTGLVAETASERERRHDAVAAQGLSRLTQIRLLILIAAVLAVTAAMGSMVWQRRDLIAFMKIDGYRRGVLWRWLLCESAVLLATGCTIGAVVGVYGEVLGTRFLASVTGFPVVFHLQALPAFFSLALVTCVAVGVTALPGYLVARVPPSAASPAY
jgi:putative ABC transport system permease protein